MKKLLLIPVLLFSVLNAKHLTTLTTGKKYKKMKIEKIELVSTGNPNQKSYITKYLEKVSNNYKNTQRDYNILHKNTYNGRDKFSGKKEDTTELFDLLFKGVDKKKKSSYKIKTND